MAQAGYDLLMRSESILTALDESPGLYLDKSRRKRGCSSAPLRFPRLGDLGCFWMTFWMCRSFSQWHDMANDILSTIGTAVGVNLCKPAGFDGSSFA